MSVSGFSVQHDPEVQAYKKHRAAYLEREKEAKKHQQKLQLQHIKQVRRAYLQQDGKRGDTTSTFSLSRIFHLRSRSKPQNPQREKNMLTTEEEKLEKEKLLDFDSDSDSELAFTG
ncbi:hypothetical protein H2204_012581 [Knufia peltigerae]|uniref:Uncharacterized protein n=1 Tax=Knufia peltigerae TaxID=1002370 RepID=A0AA39CSW2_9EURO|nr:hypothetical protein H2204_012581 [Knufia peltigerae]